MAGQKTHHFSFRNVNLPLWVIEVQWQRYLIRYGHVVRHDPYIKRRFDQRHRRIQAYLKQGSLTAAAEQLRVKKMPPEVTAIRRAVIAMLKIMKAADHNARWPTEPDPLLLRESLGVDLKPGVWRTDYNPEPLLKTLEQLPSPVIPLEPVAPEEEPADG